MENLWKNISYFIYKWDYLGDMFLGFKQKQWFYSLKISFKKAFGQQRHMFEPKLINTIQSLAFNEAEGSMLGCFVVVHPVPPLSLLQYSCTHWSTSVGRF